jgi:uncharacterized NAD-dependent epimerase/dehydratase family protein
MKVIVVVMGAPSLSHFLYHVGLKLLIAAAMMAIVYWVVHQAQHWDKRGKRKLPKVASLNRQQRRQHRAMNDRKRRH